MKRHLGDSTSCSQSVLIQTVSSKKSTSSEPDSTEEQAYLRPSYCSLLMNNVCLEWGRVGVREQRQSEMAPLGSLVS